MAKGDGRFALGVGLAITAGVAGLAGIVYLIVSVAKWAWGA